MVRRLILMRHAKAEQVAPTDHQRPLSRRGRADAIAAGEQLAELRLFPDYALVSSAARTIGTWDGVAPSIGANTQVVVERSLYGAAAAQVLEEISLVPAEIETLIVIGHNPTMDWLSFDLDDGDESGASARAVVASGFPTCAVTVFEVAEGWADIGTARCRLVDAFVGRG
jgi:phosphohistidine phosphatase